MNLTHSPTSYATKHNYHYNTYLFRLNQRDRDLATRWKSKITRKTTTNERYKQVPQPLALYAPASRVQYPPLAGTGTQPKAITPIFPPIHQSVKPSNPRMQIKTHQSVIQTAHLLQLNGARVRYRSATFSRLAHAHRQNKNTGSLQLSPAMPSLGCESVPSSPWPCSPLQHRCVWSLVHLLDVGLAPTETTRREAIIVRTYMLFVLCWWWGFCGRGREGGS